MFDQFRFCAIYIPLQCIIHVFFSFLGSCAGSYGPMVLFLDQWPCRFRSR